MMYTHQRTRSNELYRHLCCVVSRHCPRCIEMCTKHTTSPTLCNWGSPVYGRKVLLYILGWAKSQIWTSCAKYVRLVMIGAIDLKYIVCWCIIFCVKGKFVITVDWYEAGMKHCVDICHTINELDVHHVCWLFL